MVIADILALTPDEAYKKLTAKATPKVSAEDIAKQIDPLQHDVFDESKRPKKTVKKATGKDAAGNITYSDKQEEVARIAVPLQMLIVERTIGFVLGNPVKLRSDAEGDKQIRLVDMVKKLWKDNKLDYKNRELARTLFSECEVAELWYLAKDEEYWENANTNLRPKCKLLKPSDGNKLIPLYDEYGDMMAFSREYLIERDGKKITVLETYTAEKTIVFEKGETVTIVKEETNTSKKIPVVYYQQKYPEWHKVQVLTHLAAFHPKFIKKTPFFTSK
ncbi:SPP1 Gp6-like portal protein [Breznakibacter xylanolyticus]|uniref:SPP1 Gp6-like portal protein n=1 Tax=Breznakibacter xylanolyticus TaxID=990 RepID=A0A2W7NCD9_9BACT|nr:phage portal protein [Breznakibacter xylanolyticus]PZX18095.1 SPP1 Gp6-like portal protein [Breznakibacter xylanolyticus]